MPTYIKTGLWENLKTTAPKNWLNLTKLINDNISSNYKPSILDSLKITDTAPTTVGLYRLSEVGTYTNLGGLVTTAGKINDAYFNGTTWSLVSVDVNRNTFEKKILTSLPNSNFSSENSVAYYGIGNGQSFYVNSLPNGGFFEIILYSGSCTVNGNVITGTAVILNASGVYKLYTENGIIDLVPYVPTPLNIRYIKETIEGGSNMNSAAIWIELQAFKNGANIALNKPVLSNIPTVIQSPASSLTNGNTIDDMIISNTGQGPVGSYYVRVDLQSVFTLDEIKVWHYYADERYFKKIKLEVSEDENNWTTIFNSDVDGEYTETQNGKSHTNLAI